jgi:hypothetical protein
VVAPKSAVLVKLRIDFVQQLQPAIVDVVVLVLDVVLVVLEVDVDVVDVDVEVDVVDVEVLVLVEFVVDVDVDVVDVEVLEVVDVVVEVEVVDVDVLVVDDVVTELEVEVVEVDVEVLVDVVVVVGAPGQRQVSPHAVNAPPGLDGGQERPPGGSHCSPASTIELPQIGPTVVLVVDEVLVLEDVLVDDEVLVVDEVVTNEELVLEEVLVDVVVDSIVDVVVGAPGQRQVSPHAVNAPPGLDGGQERPPGGSHSSPASTIELPQIGPTTVEVVVDDVLVEVDDVDPITDELVELDVLVEVDVVEVEVVVLVEVVEVEVDVDVDVVVVVVGTGTNSTVVRSVRMVLAAKVPLSEADAPTARSAFGAQSRPSTVELRDACTLPPPMKKWMSVGDVTPSEPVSEPLASMTSPTTRISDGPRTRSRSRLPTRRLQKV